MNDEPAKPEVRASVVIPTRNRHDELRLAVHSALAQTVPVEVLVMDDGSDDGTAEMLKRDFPQVRYYCLAKGQGPTFQRNRGIALATAPIVFPIDDDAIMVSRHTVEQTLQEFDRECVGAVGIPYINVRVDNQVRQRAPEGGGAFVTSAFVGAAHAVRRDVFLKIGGYREHFFYMGEEGDLCIRMLVEGHVTRVGRADAMHHLESPRRSMARADYCGRRNDVLFVWHNVPWPYFPLHLVATTFNGLVYGLKVGRPLRMLRGLLAGYAACFRHLRERKPVTVAAYQLVRELRRREALPLAEAEKRLRLATEPLEADHPQTTPPHRGTTQPRQTASWICCQLGAREHYSIPRCLHRIGELDSLLTDAWVPPQSPLLWLPRRTLQERFHPDLDRARVKAWNARSVGYAAFRSRSEGSGWDSIVIRNRWFQERALAELKRIARRQPGRPFRLFSYSYTARRLFEFAREQGWSTVLGQIDPGPPEERIVQRLHQENPSQTGQWQPAPAEYWQDWRRECELADRVVVNSAWSREALGGEGVPLEKLRVVPLAFEGAPEAAGFPREYPAQFTARRPLRVLFLGQINLRKGMGPVLEAMRLLRDEPMEFWFVGPLQIDVPDDLRNDRRIQWVGAVARGRTADYYRRADVFLFPTFSDGFGLTQLEAQAWRLPIIASRFCGEVVTEGRNGQVLPEVTAGAIAGALGRCVRQPALLEEWSRRAVCAGEFGLDSLGRRLLALF